MVIPLLYATDWDRPCSNAAGSISIGVLGAVVVDGCEGRFTRRAARDLVIYLALHPGGVTYERLGAALWPEDASNHAVRHAAVAAARRAIGGSQRRVRIETAREGLALAGSFHTDWSRFAGLARSTDPGAHARALALVRGQPFDGAAPEWALSEGLLTSMCERICEVALTIAEESVGAGDLPAATDALARGIAACPYDERLYRRAMTVFDAAGHPDGVRATLERLLVALGASRSECATAVGAGGTPLLRNLVHPQTAAHYRRLLGSGSDREGDPCCDC